MPKALRVILGAVLLIATIGVSTCQSMLNAGPLPAHDGRAIAEQHDARLPAL